MKKFLFFFIGLFSLVHAQQILITGKIVVDDATEVLELDGITVINQNTNAKTITNSTGLFSINVNPNDELLFKDGGIENRTIKITESMIKKGFVMIHLNLEVIELAETNILTLNKDMLKNMGKEKSVGEKLNDEMGFVSSEFKASLNLKSNEAKVNRTINAVGGVSVLGLVGLLTKSHKKIKNVAPIEKNKGDHLLDLKRLYTETYFVENLHIPSGKIIEFLDYCYTNFEFNKLLNDNNFDEILFVIEEQAPLFLKKINQSTNE